MYGLKPVPFTLKRIFFTLNAVPFTPKRISFTLNAVPFTPKRVPVKLTIHYPASGTRPSTNAIADVRRSQVLSSASSCFLPARVSE
jgi:hypothetical protein